MRKLLLAALAAMTLGLGAAQAAPGAQGGGRQASQSQVQGLMGGGG